MLNKFTLSLTSLLVLGLSGCTGVRDKLGLDPNAPDEFTVYDRAPLSVPPKYALRPPEPSAQGAAQAAPTDAAQKILSGGEVPPSRPVESSEGAKALLDNVQAQSVDPSIRAQVDEDLSLDKKPADKKLLDDVLSFQKKTPKGEEIDPVAEKARLDEQKAQQAEKPAEVTPAPAASAQ